MPDFVTVACKLPSGLIIQDYEMIPALEAVQGGPPREIMKARARPQRFKINGNGMPMNKTPPEHLRGAVGLTHGVPADLWDRWYEQNIENGYVVNKLIYAAEKGSERDREADLLAIAKEYETQRSGFEQLERRPTDDKTPGLVTTAPR